KRREQTEDIWSTLASAVITGEDGEEFSLPANELEFFFFVLTFAGSDTTKNAMAIGLQAFVANPEQMERYREQEALRPSAVEEVLRWASPVAYWTRTAKVDVEMDGQHLPQGDRVVSMLRSANRDEEVFSSPFTFDIGRQPNPQVAFGGGGPHHCLGAMLARAELRAVFDELLLRCDDITLGPAKAAYPNLFTTISIYDAMAISLTWRYRSNPAAVARPWGTAPPRPVHRSPAAREPGRPRSAPRTRRPVRTLPGPAIHRSRWLHTDQRRLLRASDAPFSRPFASR